MSVHTPPAPPVEIVAPIMARTESHNIPRDLGIVASGDDMSARAFQFLKGIPRAFQLIIPVKMEATPK